MPADLAGVDASYSAHSLAANDEKIRRRYTVRTAARESFMRMQNDDQLRRAIMLARARTVTTSSHDVGHEDGGSQVSPASWMLLPQVGEQSLSLLALQPVGQQPSPSTQLETGG